MITAEKKRKKLRREEMIQIGLSDKRRRVDNTRKEKGGEEKSQEELRRKQKN